MPEQPRAIATELALADALDRLVNLIEELRADADLHVEITTHETNLVKLAFSSIHPLDDSRRQTGSDSICNGVSVSVISEIRQHLANAHLLINRGLISPCRGRATPPASTRNQTASTPGRVQPSYNLSLMENPP